MLDVNAVNKFFSEYFHPEILWEKGIVGKVKAIGAVLSWGIVILPIIMAIGLLVSNYCLKGKVSDKNKPGRSEQIEALGIRHLNLNGKSMKKDRGKSEKSLT
jgi:hypothetical protein